MAPSSSWISPVNWKAEEKEEKERVLSPSEQRRMDHFQDVCTRMREQGYEQHELSIGLVKANVIVLIAAIPLCLLTVWLYMTFAPISETESELELNPFVVVVVLIALIFAHELIHGFFWGLFAEHHFRDIELGFIWKYLTPYCTCSTPLKKWQYCLGGIMPLVLVGIIPLICGIALASPDITILGLIMTIAAGGDVLILIKLLRFKTDATDIEIYDHPTQAGSVIFTRA
jgi:hypothetical protein